MEVASKAKVAPFHADTDPEDLVYHATVIVPLGRRSTEYSIDAPRPDGRRGCDWCAEHAYSNFWTEVGCSDPTADGSLGGHRKLSAPYAGAVRRGASARHQR